ncbi:fimbrial protein [Cupriavidus basilensis]
MNYPSTVTLQDARAVDLRPAGATTGTKAFSIGLTCDSVAQVGITFDGAAGTPIQSASTGVLGASNARAGRRRRRELGFRLVNAGTYSPVPLQVRNDLGSIVANTLTNYNYAVRYISLNNGQPVTAGGVSGSAIFTFDYQ